MLTWHYPIVNQSALGVCECVISLSLSLSLCFSLSPRPHVLSVDVNGLYGAQVLEVLRTGHVARTRYLDADGHVSTINLFTKIHGYDTVCVCVRDTWVRHCCTNSRCRSLVSHVLRILLQGYELLLFIPYT